MSKYKDHLRITCVRNRLDSCWVMPGPDYSLNKQANKKQHLE